MSFSEEMSEKIDGIDLDSLSGPKIDRRTTMKMMLSAGYVGAASALAGCTGGTEDGKADGGSGEGDQGDTEQTPESGVSSKKVTVGYLADSINRMNPYAILSNTGTRATAQIMTFPNSGLLTVMPGEGIVGDIAADWNAVDGTTWEFQIRENLKFHDGEPIDATSVKKSYEYILEQGEKLGSAYDEMKWITDMEVPDSHTLVLRTDEPVSMLPSLLTDEPGSGDVMPVDRYDIQSEEFRFKPVGAGPFVVEEINPGQNVIFSRFKDHYETDEDGNQLPYVDELEVRVIPEPSTLYAALESGSVDLAVLLGGNFANQADQNPDLSVTLTENATWACIAMLCNKPHEHKEWAKHAAGTEPENVTEEWKGKDLPTSDAKVRRAIAMAIDRDEVAEKAYFGWAKPAHHIINETITWLYEEEPDPGQYYDPERAGELLDEAGYTGNPRFSAPITCTPSREREFQVLVEQLSRDPINLDLELQVIEDSAYFSTIYSYTEMLIEYDGSADIDPYQSWGKQLHTPNKPGWGTFQKNLYSNPKFDELLEKSFRATDREERKQHGMELKRIFIEDAPYAMTVHPQVPLLHTNDLGGVVAPAGMLKPQFLYNKS